MEFHVGNFLLGVLQLAGSLGVFLFGMQMMSEALQKVAGQKMRSILAWVTKNKFVGILTGMLITAVIQSSSATTVMTVSFVNAGLINLVQAFSVIMGANIGTTATAWIISLLGFSVDINTLSIPLIAFALPLYFSSKPQRKYWGELIFGFAILFLGLGFLKNSVPDVAAHPDALAFLKHCADWGYGSVLIFMCVGVVLTIVVQSSSATVAITLVMCAEGWVELPVACAMVMGENIGTTITANLAALNANLSAKRAALSHTMFNLFGVCWVLVLFYPFYHLVDGFVLSWHPSSEDIRAAWTISLFHSLFNVCNVLVLCWFSKYIVCLVEKILRPKQTRTTEMDDEPQPFAYISMGLMSTSELSLVQASKEVHLYGEKIQHMFASLPSLLSETDDNAFVQQFERIRKREDRSDEIEHAIIRYITQVSAGHLSAESKQQTQQIVRMASEIESIADGCYKMACIIKNNREKQVHLVADDQQSLLSLYQDVAEAICNMLQIISAESVNHACEERSRELELQINALRSRLLEESTLAASEGSKTYAEGSYFRDLVRVLERVGDYVVNVVEAKANHKIFKDASFS